MDRFEISQKRLGAAIAADRLLRAGRRLRWALRNNPYWHLQPRVPAGRPDGGRWLPSGPLAPGASLLPTLRQISPAAAARLREVGRRIAPKLRRLPWRWNRNAESLAEDDFDAETRRIGPPSWHRFGHPTMRFRNERELRDFLGPAGSGREWHHIVEKRLAGRPEFPPEMIHNTDNIVNLPVEVHRRISAKMSMRDRSFGDHIRRFVVEKMTVEEQYEHGLVLISETLEELGYEPDQF